MFSAWNLELELRAEKLLFKSVQNKAESNSTKLTACWAASAQGQFMSIPYFFYRNGWLRAARLVIHSVPSRWNDCSVEVLMARWMNPDSRSV